MDYLFSSHVICRYGNTGMTFGIAHLLLIANTRTQAFRGSPMRWKVAKGEESRFFSFGCLYGQYNLI